MRRLRAAAWWLILGGGVAALLLSLAITGWKDRSRSMRLAHTGEQSLCTVISKRKNSGRSTYYYVRLKCDAFPPLPAFERSVARDDWEIVQPGMKAVYYSDPGNPGEGIADLERSLRERLSPVILRVLLLAGLSALVLWRLWTLAREMRLLRIGVEQVEPRSASGGWLVAQLGPVALRRRSFLPDRWDIRVRSPAGGMGRVVLRAPDQSSYFYPTLSDVAVERLTGHERPSSMLGRSPRPPHLTWSSWSARRRRRNAFPTLLLTGFAAVALGFTFAFTNARSWWALVGIILATDAAFFVAWMRSFSHDRSLWRDGVEIQAVLLEEDRRRGARGYRVGYDYHGHEFEATGWLPLGLSPLFLQSPPEAPAVTMRVLILVDPHQPHRWSLLPHDLGGR